MKKEKIKITYKRKLNHNDLEKIAEDMSTLIKQIEELEEGKKSIADEYNLKIKSHRSNLAVEAMHYRNKHIETEVMAHFEKDYTSKTIKYFNDETGEVYKIEPFRDGDNQREFDF